MQKVDFNQALEILRAGEILIYPTETCYGVGVDARQSSALEKLLALKGRSAAQTLSILVGSSGAAGFWGDFSDPRARRLAECYWPGPLTLVVPAISRLPDAVISGDGSIGIRVSSHPIASRLAQGFGGPLTTTSANRSGEPSAVSLAELERYFGADSDVHLLAGGDLPPSKGSTIVKIESGDLKLLREGEIPFREISAYIEK